MASKQSQRRKAAQQRDTESLEYRAFSVRAATVNEESRTVDATISTEAPVPMFDAGRMEYVPEILLASGVDLPNSRQVPLLDSHARNSINDQLGSARGIRIDGGEVIGTLNFSRSADRQWDMVRDGHATDVSAGYQILKRVFVPRGETREIENRSFTGPANVVTKWRLREVSLTPIGADEQAKLRGLDASAQTDSENFEMKPELREMLIARGMPEALSDDDAQVWAVRNLSATPVKETKPTEERKDIDSKGSSSSTLDYVAIANTVAEVARKEIEKRDEAQRLYFAEVDSLCALADLPNEAESCRRLGDVAKVREHLAAAKAKNSESGVAPFPSIRVTGEGSDRMLADLGTALTMRAVGNVAEKSATVDKVFPVAQRGSGADRWRNAGPFAIAEECVRLMGIDTRGATREQIAITAMFGPRPELGGLAARAVGTAALHTTGSFLKLTQDALNKSMQVGYMEAPSTWEGPMRQGMSVPDFKTIHRMRMGAIPNLPVWNDNRDPEQASFADADETYAVESRSLEVGFSYRLLVNDDMSALSRVPAQMGAAARRTVNSVAWSVITANPTMSDSVALFSTATGARKRDNLQTGSATPTTTTVGAMTKLMRLMRGENTPEGNESDDVLNLQPRYIVGPAALEVLINQLVNSAYDPNSTAGLQNYNPNRVLTPVIEPLLDASSATAWYLFASPSQIDTVEVTFLQGQETPVVRQFMDERKLSQNWIVLQTFAAKAMNHRGIQKHAGA